MESRFKSPNIVRQTFKSSCNGITILVNESKEEKSKKSVNVYNIWNFIK